MAPKDETETVTVTFRIPELLKSLVEQYAAARGDSLTSVLRSALEDAVAPKTRVYELPGFSSQFDGFIEKAERRAVMLLVIDSNGYRYFFRGHIDRNKTNTSLVTLEYRSKERVILRRDVVGWFLNVPGVMNELSMRLVEQGWASRLGDFDE